MRTRILIEALAFALLAALCAPVGPAIAQTPAQPTNAGPVQPWGLPPLPPGVGPVEKFADIKRHAAGQVSRRRRVRRPGQFVVCRDWQRLDLLPPPDGKLVPVVNCNPPDDYRPDLRAAGHALAGRQALPDDPAPRHPGLRPENQGAEDAGLHLAQPAVQRPQRPRFRRRGQPLLHRPVGDRAWTEPVRPVSGAVYQYSKDGILRKVMDDLNFPNGIAVSPDNSPAGDRRLHGQSNGLRDLPTGRRWARRAQSPTRCT